MSEMDGTCEYVLDPDDPETWGGEEGDECYVEEEVLNEDGVWTCPHDAEKDEFLCIFHLPLTKKNSDSKVKKLQEFILSSEYSTGEKCNQEFIGSKFGDLNIGEIKVQELNDNPIHLSHANFQGDVFNDGGKIEFPLLMKGVTFNGNLSLSESEFSYVADFSGSTIFGRSVFEDSKFCSDVYFINTIFKEHTNFLGAEFTEGGGFSNSIFEDICIFSHSTFSDVTFFKDAKFHERLDFDATFEDQIHFDEATFFDESSFRAEFKGIANFEFTDFKHTADFFGATFEDWVSFGQSKLYDANFKQSTFKDKIAFIESELINADFSEVDLSGSNFSDSHSNGHTKFNRSDLTDANFSDASLSGTELERALLNRCDLFGTKLQGAAFYGAVFGDAQINEETEFGNRCVYDTEFDNETAAEIDDDDTGRLTKAAGQYRIIEQLARTNAFPDMVSHNFIRRQDIHREQHRQEGRLGRWLRATASKYVLEYGENPWRLIATGLVIVVGFGLLYPLVGGLQPTGSSPITASRVVDNPLLLAQSIYYSTLTFTTLGMGDFLPVGLGRVLTTLETSLGAIIIALLVFVFGRRAAR